MYLSDRYSNESEFIVVSARDRLFNRGTVDLIPFIHVFHENDIELSSSELDVDDNDTQIERINDCVSYSTFKSEMDIQLIDDGSVSAIMKEFDFEVELQQQWRQTLIIDNYMQNKIKSKEKQTVMYSEKQSSTDKESIHFIDDNTVFESSAAELYSLIEQHSSSHTNNNTFEYSFAKYYTKNEMYADNGSYSTDFHPWIFICTLIAMMFVNALFNDISPILEQSNINSTVVYLTENNDHGSTLDNYKMMNDDLIYDDIWNQLFVDIVSVYRDTHSSSLIQAYSQYILLLQQCYWSLLSTSSFALFPSASNSVIESSFWQCGECQTNGSLLRNSLQCRERTVDDVIFCKHILSNSTFIDFLCLQFDCSKMIYNEIGSYSNQNKCQIHSQTSLVSASVMSDYTLFAWFAYFLPFISSLAI